MTLEEFNSIKAILKGSFQYNGFLAEKETVNVWFNMLNQFPYEIARRGVLDYIEFNNKTPTINDIMVSIRKAQEYTKKFRNSKKTYVKCPKCNDNGFTIRTYPNGSEYMFVCECEAAHEKYPWQFMSARERDEYYEEEQRKGRSAQRAFHAERDFVRDYLYPKARTEEDVDKEGKPKISMADLLKGKSNAFKELLEE